MERPNQYDEQFPERRDAEEEYAATHPAEEKNKIPPEQEEEIKAAPKQKSSFDPEAEVKNILKGPRSEHKKNLENFKEKLSGQNEKLAEFYEDMVLKIKKSPSNHADNFQFIKEKAESLGLSPTQVETATDAFNSYVSKHNEVSTIRKKYPDNSQLYEAIFKKYPKGKVEVIEGPMTLYFKCFNEIDYALIYSGAPMKNRDLTQHDIDSANCSLGVAPDQVPIPSLQGCVLAENTSQVQKAIDAGADPKTTNTDSIMVHEEQHAIKKLFTDYYFRRNAVEKVMSSTNDKKIEEALLKTFRADREDIAEHRVKDEILAYFKQNSDPNLTYQILTRGRSEGGAYDYKAAYKTGIFSSDELEEIRKNKKKMELLKKAEKKVYVDEYHKMVKDGIRNVFFLKSKGYSDEQVIGILITEPLSKWPKVVGRLVAGKRIAKEKK